MPDTDPAPAFTPPDQWRHHDGSAVYRKGEAFISDHVVVQYLTDRDRLSAEVARLREACQEALECIAAVRISETTHPGASVKERYSFVNEADALMVEKGIFTLRSALAAKGGGG